jgi:phosphatidylglycerol lysyltransferase
MKRLQRILVPFLGLITFGSGIVTLLAVLHPKLPAQRAYLQDAFPLEFYHVSRLLTVPLGLALVISSLNVLKRKHGAYQLVLALSVAGAVGHWFQGHHAGAAILAAVLAVLLFLTRKSFTVRSGPLDLRSGALRIAITVAIAVLYGVLGFWLLDRREFGINFHAVDALHRTLRQLMLWGNPDLVPHTRYARWFLHSLSLLTATTIAYTLLSCFRPAIYRYRTYPHERQAAEAITRQHGRSSMDFFKYWPDKSFFFSASGRSFLAYRVGGSHALVLGDPLGPAEELPPLIEDFARLCRDNDWGLAFHQTLPDLLPVYEAAGFHRLKIGDDAIVLLPQFGLEGRAGKEFRGTVNRMEREGFRFELHQPPITDTVLAQCREISQEWLRIPGRRERGFTLGRFEHDYVRNSPLGVAWNQEGRAQGFVNLIPSFRSGEATIDLMRRRGEGHPGTMDYLFVKLLLHLKEEGYERFNLGMAPMAGFQEGEPATVEERAMHAFFQRLNFLFSYEGLRAYKAKFASTWEPRYLVFQNILQLPAVAIALGRVSGVEQQEE